MDQNETSHGGIGLGPGNIVLAADPAPLCKKGAQPQNFLGPCLLWPNGWMYDDMPLDTQVGLGSDDIVLDGDPAPSPYKGHSPHF